MLRKWIGNWLRNDRGTVTVYLALGTVVFLPLMGIAIDATNYYKLHTELDQAAEAAALAAAMEMDFTDDGLAAATTAAREAVTNFEMSANDNEDSEIFIETVQFLRALPPAGNYNYFDYVTTDSGEARYVRVITETRQRWSTPYATFLAMWRGEDTSGAIKATAADAVAAKVTVACKAQPIMMCNPAEVTADCGNANVADEGEYQLYSDFLRDNPEWRRRQFRVKWIGPQTAIEPGVFGLLKPISGTFGFNGQNPIAHELAYVDPSSCVQIENAELEAQTGQMQAVTNGLNTRFDIFRASFGSYKDDPNYAPALNRTKSHLPASQGGGGSACAPQEVIYEPPEPIESMKLPQDSCFQDDPSAQCDALGQPDPNDPQGNYAGRYGNGVWDVITYFNVNHPIDDGGENPIGTPNPAGDGISDWTADELDPILKEIHERYGINKLDVGSLPAEPYDAGAGTGDDSKALVSVANPPSRWAVYRWETAAAVVGGVGVAENRDPDIDAMLPPNSPDRIPGQSTRMNGITKEEGRSGVSGAAGASCSTVPALGPSRRVLYIAVVNCCDQAEELSSGERRIKITEFAKAFMTEPANATSGGGNNEELGALFLEVFDAVPAGDADEVILRDYVQLY
jgi:hypothetical protein